jgi:hypothetical protein
MFVHVFNIIGNFRTMQENYFDLYVKINPIPLKTSNIPFKMNFIILSGLLSVNLIVT